MTDNIHPKPIPQAVPIQRKKSRISPVWIIPLLAALVAVGIAVQSFLGKGPTITILFNSAEGLEAGKTFVKYKDIHIGLVDKVRLTDDYSRIEVIAGIDKHAEGLIVEDTKFWVVQPRITLSGVSGMGTLFSGNYIGVDPGSSTVRRNEFVGLDVPPMVTDKQPGREFILRADNLGSLGIGSPVYYRRLAVGRVIGYDLCEDGESVEVTVFVNAPYDRFVTRSTRFWEAGGFDVTLGAEGIDVRTQSLVSILIGGVAFEEPEKAPPGAQVPDKSRFVLYKDRKTAFKEVETDLLAFVLHFQSSLRGLAVGAPVTMFGLPVGEVTEVGVEYDPDTMDIRPRVEVEVYPIRLSDRMHQAETFDDQPWDTEQERALLQSLVDRGLRAQLRTGNLLSGQLYVALDYFPDAPRVELDWNREVPQWPVVSGGFEAMERKVTSILDKLDGLPLDEIGRGVVKGLDALNATLEQFQKLAAGMDREITPELKSTLDELKKTLGTAERALGHADDSVLGPDAPLQHQLGQMLRDISRAARVVHDLADYLERNPESLLRGKKEGKP